MHGVENADVPVGLIIIVPFFLVGIVADTLVFSFIDLVFGGNPGEVGVGQAIKGAAGIACFCAARRHGALLFYAGATIQIGFVWFFDGIYGIGSGIRLRRLRSYEFATAKLRLTDATRVDIEAGSFDYVVRIGFVWIFLAVGDDEVFVVFAGLAIAEVVGRVGIVGVFGFAAVTQFLHAAEDAALELGFIPLQLSEGLVVAEVVEEELAEDVLVGAGVVFGDGTAEIVEDQCLVALGTLDAPGHAGNAADEEDFAGIERFVLVHEFVGEGVELGGVFDGDGGPLGGQAVDEGVAGGTGLACGGSGAGGFFCIKTICLDLFDCWHDLLLS